MKFFLGVLLLFGVMVRASEILIPYQAMITDQHGNPVVDSIYTADFLLYTDATSDQLLWQETQRQIRTKKGVFTHHLGSHTPLQPELLAIELFLQVDIDGFGRLAENRIRVTGSHFSYRSLQSDSATIAMYSDSATVASYTPQAAHSEQSDSAHVAALAYSAIHAQRSDSAQYSGLAQKAIIADSSLKTPVADSSYLAAKARRLDVSGLVSTDNSIQILGLEDGTLQLSLPQSIDTLASLQLQDLTVTGNLRVGTYLVAGQDSSSVFKSFGKSLFQTWSGTIPFTIARHSYGTQEVLRIGVTDRSVDFRYIEDTKNEPAGGQGEAGNFGVIRFYLGGTLGESDQKVLQLSKEHVHTPRAFVADSFFISQNMDTVASTYSTVGFRFTEHRGWGYNREDDAIFYNAYYSVPFILQDAPDNSFVLREDGKIGIGVFTPQYKLDVAGNMRVTGNVTANNFPEPSDRRYKLNITRISSALTMIDSLQGVYYSWDREKFPGKNFSAQRQVGVIAQEVEKVVPEIVATGEDGYKSVSYSKLTVLLLEALKEEKQKRIALQNRLEKQLATLTASVEAMHNSTCVDTAQGN